MGCSGGRGRKRGEHRDRADDRFSISCSCRRQWHRRGAERQRQSRRTVIALRSSRSPTSYTPLNSVHPCNPLDYTIHPTVDIFHALHGVIRTGNPLVFLSPPCFKHEFVRALIPGGTERKTTRQRFNLASTLRHQVSEIHPSMTPRETLLSSIATVTIPFTCTTLPHNSTKIRF